MIDRLARDRMAATVQDYLDDKITAFQFDDQLDAAGAGTRDETVKSVRILLWGCYSDDQDGPLVASKEAWDYFYRLLLLLKSDAEMEKVAAVSPGRWNLRNKIAAGTLAIFVALAFRLGFGPHLMLVSFPFGIVSILLSRWEKRECRQTPRKEIALLPFPALASLLRVRRTVPVFAKKRYPPALAQRRHHSLGFERCVTMIWGIMWLIFAPIPLFFQMLPVRESKIKITLAESPWATVRT